MNAVGVTVALVIAVPAAAAAASCAWSRSWEACRSFTAAAIMFGAIAALQLWGN